MRLFENFKELYGLFQKVSVSNNLLQQFRANSHKHEMRVFPGDLVYRKFPEGARLPKHLFSENVKGPYRVKEIHGNSAVLIDVGSGALIDAGHKIPFGQLIKGPEHKDVAFDQESDVRPLSAMLNNEKPQPHQLVTGHRAGKKHGWGPLAIGAYVAYQVITDGQASRDLAVGKILLNHRVDQ